ncbi:MAG: hypothetical protein CME19_06280 [Gemmatimonadetes bacterium]|nr:hypothetical protein [Gemmatimonadota bacterium]|tara:strand:- start:1403 stop:2056 length:654 start_codon:yes stop_codon:yes gene_type:complete
MRFFQRTLPLAIAMIAGLLGILTFYIPVWAEFETRSAIWFRIVFAFAMILGIHSLLHMHWVKVTRAVQGWAYSAVTIVAFVITLLFGLYNAGAGPFAPQDLKSGGLVWIYDNIFVSAGATMFSLLAFFIASAAYRTFRARSTEAAILLVAAICVMLGRVPIGAAISEYLPILSQWLMDTPNMAARRGILIGVSLGAIATALRIIFGIERSWLGEEKQ